MKPQFLLNLILLTSAFAFAFALPLEDMETAQAQAQIKGKGLISKMMKAADVNPNLVIVGGAIVSNFSNAAVPIYALGTNLLFNAWGGTDYITNGSPIKLHQNAGAPASNELWTFQADGSITTPTSTGGVLCLDSAHVNSTLPANQLILYVCNSNNVNQKWTWDSSTGTIENTGTGYCLDASVNGINSTNQLALAPCNANIIGQRFNTYKELQHTIKSSGIVFSVPSEDVGVDVDVSASSGVARSTLIAVIVGAISGVLLLLAIILLTIRHHRRQQHKHTIHRTSPTPTPAVPAAAAASSSSGAHDGHGGLTVNPCTAIIAVQDMTMTSIDIDSGNHGQDQAQASSSTMDVPGTVV